MTITSDRGARLRALALSFSTAAVAALALSACGGGGGGVPAAPSGSPGPVPSPAPTPTYAIGGSIAGLDSAGLALTDGTNTLAVDAGATSFVFPGRQADGTAYSVTIAAQPASRAQTCSLGGGSGTLAGADASVAVECHATQWSASSISGGQQDFATAYVDGPAAASTFLFTRGDVARGADGNLYVADAGDSVIRRIAPDGTSSTYAGARQSGFSRVAVDGPAASAMFKEPSGLAFGPDGSLFVADEGAIRKIAADGTVSTFAGSNTLLGNVDGAAVDARFRGALALRFGPDGSLFVVDYEDVGNYVIRKVAADGAVSTFAGSGSSGIADGTGTAASFLMPQSLAIDAGGDVYVGDVNAIRKITPDGVVSTLVANSDYGQGLDCPAIPDSGHPICSTRGLAFDAAGNLYVADDFMERMLLIAPDGTITTAYSGPLEFGPTSILVDTDGTVVVANHTGATSAYRDSVERLSPN